MRITQALILALLITFITSAHAEIVPIRSYAVSFEQPIGHDRTTDSLTNNPDICRVNIFTPEYNQIASFTIKRFDSPQDASREVMEKEVKDILIDCGTSEHSIVTQEYGIDQCYCIKGIGDDYRDKNWIAVYYWIDRYWDRSQQKWMGWTSCAIISNYPNSEDLLGSVHITNQTS